MELFLRVAIAAGLVLLTLVGGLYALRRPDGPLTIRDLLLGVLAGLAYFALAVALTPGASGDSRSPQFEIWTNP